MGVVTVTARLAAHYFLISVAPPSLHPRSNPRVGLQSNNLRIDFCPLLSNVDDC